MAAVRSTRLGDPVRLGSSGAAAIYTCPAGRLAIVKSLRVVSAGSAAAQFDLIVNTALAGSFYLFRLAPVVADGLVYDSTWHILEEGDELAAFVWPGSGDLDFWASGAELLGAGP